MGTLSPVTLTIPPQGGRHPPPPHFNDEKTEAPRYDVTCQEWHSSSEVELRPHPGPPSHGNSTVSPG